MEDELTGSNSNREVFFPTTEELQKDHRFLAAYKENVELCNDVILLEIESELIYLNGILQHVIFSLY
jgi:hypothetical protein